MKADYKEENIKDDFKAGIVRGYEMAAEDLQCALDNYCAENDDDIQIIKELRVQIANNVVEYCKKFILEQKDWAVVAILDEEKNEHKD